MTCYESLIDGTSFGRVRQYLHNPRSDISDVLFVTTADLLPEIAELLDAENHSPAELRQFRWEALLRSGQVIPNALTQGFGLDIQAVDDEAFCRVIYMPPLYLVYLPTWRSIVGAANNSTSPLCRSHAIER